MIQFINCGAYDMTIGNGEVSHIFNDVILKFKTSMPNDISKIFQKHFSLAVKESVEIKIKKSEGDGKTIQESNYQSSNRPQKNY